MTATAMRPVDVAWRRMDAAGEAPVNMIWSMWLEGAIGRERVLQELMPRLLGHARLRQRPAREGRRWRWVPSEVDPEQHVEERQVGQGIEDHLATLMAEPLSPERPPWRVSLLQQGRSTVLVWVFHHCVADALALSWLFEQIADQPGPDGGEPSRLARLPSLPPLRPTRVPAALLAMARAPSAPSIPYVGRHGPNPALACSDDLPLPRLKALAEASGCGTTDLLMALITGGLRRDLLRRGFDPGRLPLTAAVPMNLRRPGRYGDLGNAFGVVYLPLPVSLEDPAERLSSLRRARRASWLPTAARLGFAAQSLMGRLPLFAQKRMERLTGSKTALVISNMPAVVGPLTLAGRPVQSMAGWVPPSAGVSLSVGVMGYLDRIRLSVAVDAERVPDPEAIVAEVLAELAAWEAASP